MKKHSGWVAYRNDNPNALKALPQIREQVFQGNYMAAQKLVGQKL
mgnify:CR=1 FL=1